MLKALIKKQFIQTRAMFYRNGKKKEKTSKAKGLGYGVLMLYVVICIAFMFFNIANTMCEPMLMSGLSWLYFSIMALMAVTVGVVGSVFMTQSQLYNAKDNDLLLSMPIPPAMLLFVRMIVLIAYTLLFVLVIMIPTFAIYVYTVNNMQGELDLSVTPVQVIFWILITILLTLFTQSLTCILGWLVAILTSRTKNKNLMTVIFSLIFLGLYFYVVTQMNQLLGKLIANSEAIGKNMKAAVYPIYQMGLAAGGDVTAMLIFAAIVIVLFAVIYAVLTKTFITVITTNKGAAKRVYKKKAMKEKTLEQALLGKEISRLFGSASYLLNCGLGAVFLLVGAVAAIVKKEELLTLLNQMYPGMNDFLPALATVAIMFVVAVDVITAPAISLEGNTVWVLQSLPVPAESVIKAKIKLQLLFNGIPMIIFAFAIDYVLKPGIVAGILVLIVPQIFNLYAALFGLMCNLKHPTLDWTSESYAVKRNISVVIAIFGNWGILLAFILLYVLVGDYINTILFILICTIVLVLLSAWMWSWMKKKGCRIFANL